MERGEQEQIFSKKVKAGKRTYFIDVRATKSNDYFITLTESRKQLRDGEFVYEKSKVFLYKEDFDTVLEAMKESINHVKTELLPDVDFDQFKNHYENGAYTNTPKTNTEDTNLLGSDLKWE